MIAEGFLRRVNLVFFLQIFGVVAILVVGKGAYGQDERTQYFPRTQNYPNPIPPRENVWIFILAGQSNMAGRGVVQPMDTVPDNRILTINAQNEIVFAKEPLHFYEPQLAGLDCGMSFARRLIKDVDDNVTILLIPAAVGGSSSHQWLGDSLHRGVRLMTNFQERVSSAAKFGVIKGILWHQGESDTNDQSIPGYGDRLKSIFTAFRRHCHNPKLPILIGKLGSFSENQDRWNAINQAIEKYTSKDKYAFIVETADLKSKEDKIHFAAEGQRTMGVRMAESFLDKGKVKKLKQAGRSE